MKPWREWPALASRAERRHQPVDAEAFRQHGKKAIDKVIKEQPAVFLKLLVLLVPREMKLEQIEGTAETVALPAPDVVPDGPNKVIDAADTAIGPKERSLNRSNVFRF